MAYNSSAYTGIRVTQFILAVVTAVVVGLIGEKDNLPSLYYGLFPPKNDLNTAQLLTRAISTFGSFVLYPFLSLLIGCYILCCTKKCRPHAVTLCFDAFGVIMYLVSGVIFVMCIKENESPVSNLVNKFSNYLPDGLPKAADFVVNQVRTIIDGVDMEKVNYVMEGCLVYFALQVIFCAVCIYQATVYKKNNIRDESQMVLLNSMYVS